MVGGCPPCLPPLRTDREQAFVPPTLRRSEAQIYLKGLPGPPLPPRTTTSRPLSDATEMYDTDFEDELSDVEEYSGRRSEESVSRAAYRHRMADLTEVSLANEVIPPSPHSMKCERPV